MDIDLDSFLPYMRDVARCEQSLHELNLMWRMIESGAKMNCPQEARAILPTMAATRVHFNRLEQELVTSLVREKVSTVMAEIGTKAQQVIDIVVRNLYERTADVGFLATDNELCRFVAGLSGTAEAVRQRLGAYRSKYTVYDEIMLLDCQGNVLVQIAADTPVEGSSDPLIAQTLASPDYVETFRASDLRPGKRRALIYSKRMLHPESGEVIGLLCLCFHFEEELAGIFRTHRDADAPWNMLLLDAAGEAIASADTDWMPLGPRLPTHTGTEPVLKMFGGRQYLVRTCRAEGYQGYMGPPGWQGQVMVPLDVAFGTRARHGGAIDDSAAEGLLAHAQSFCPPLYEIMQTAETIRRVVWNGQVMTAGQEGELQKLKSVLDQISETGARSDALFAQSISDLYRTVLASGMRDGEFVSRLLVDLLDRNLYERSDDCRWWALTPELRQILAQDLRSAADLGKLRAILGYINSLYTVYTRIFVYDHQGRILVSNRRDGAADELEGERLDEATLDRVRQLRNEQQYCVTPFVASAHYAGQPTWVYHAAVRAPDDASRIVGGIGIVFDSAPELTAMLRAAVGNIEKASACFIDRQGRVLASTDPTHTPGSVLEIEAALLALPRGSSASRVLVHEGQYAILGCTASFGYREFKVSDGYHDDVIALVFRNFGAAQSQGQSSRRELDIAGPPAQALAHCEEYATFWVGSDLFALPAVLVSEARAAVDLLPVTMGARNESVGMLSLKRDGARDEYVWVFDLGLLIFGQPSVNRAGAQVVVVGLGSARVGLLVSDLHAVPAIDPAMLVDTPMGGSKLVGKVIKTGRSDALVQVLDLDVLHGLLKHPAAAALPGRKPVALAA